MLVVAVARKPRRRSLLITVSAGTSKVHLKTMRVYVRRLRLVPDEPANEGTDAFVNYCIDASKRLSPSATYAFTASAPASTLRYVNSAIGLPAAADHPADVGFALSGVDLACHLTAAACIRLE